MFADPISKPPLRETARRAAAARLPRFVEIAHHFVSSIRLND
jgi:hypothetical protein